MGVQGLRVRAGWQAGDGMGIIRGTRWLLRMDLWE